MGSPVRLRLWLEETSQKRDEAELQSRRACSSVSSGVACAANALWCGLSGPFGSVVVSTCRISHNRAFSGSVAASERTEHTRL